MSRYLKLIWFAEDSWTKYHAAVGIKAEKTLCGIIRSTGPILPSEKMKPPVNYDKCLRCLTAIRKRYGYDDVVEVKVK